MSRWTTANFNTGNIGAGVTYTNDLAALFSVLNIGKIKIIPSGVTVGYLFQLYKDAARAVVAYASKDPVTTNFYDPQNRAGAEAPEGWVLPYEDTDATKKIHISLKNEDAVPRSYDITIEYESPASQAYLGMVTAEPLVFGEVDVIGVGTFWVANLAHTALSAATCRLYRNGIRQKQGNGLDYTFGGNALTLTIPPLPGDYFEVEYMYAV